MDRKYNDSKLSNQIIPQNLNEKPTKDFELKEAIINVLERKNLAKHNIIEENIKI